MEIRSLFFFLFLNGMRNITVIVAEEDSTPRSALFTTQQNKRLEGHVVKRFESPSILSCSHSCLKNAWCTSTNFKVSSKKNGKGSCELNKHGAIERNTKFHIEQGVTFSMLLKVKLLMTLSQLLIFSFSWNQSNV